MLLNMNPLKKLFEEIFFLFMKSEMRKIDLPPFLYSKTDLNSNF